MEVTYKIHPDDYQAFVRHCNQTSRMMREAALKLRFGPPAAFAVLAFMVGLLLDINPVAVGATAATFGLLWVLDYPRRHAKLLDTQAKRLLGEGRNVWMLAEQRLSIAAEGLSVASPYARAQVSWAMVERVEETPSHVFIYVSSMSAHIIPKWAFDSVQKAADFVHAARSFQQRAA